METKPYDCIHLVISNPCFGIWYLLHKRYSTKKYDESEQVISELKNYSGGRIIQNQIMIPMKKQY